MLSFNVHIPRLIPCDVTNQVKACYEKLNSSGCFVCCESDQCLLKTSLDVFLLGAFHTARHRRPYTVSETLVAAISATWSFGKQIQAVTPLASAVAPEEVRLYLSSMKNIDSVPECLTKYNLPLLFLYLQMQRRTLPQDIFGANVAEIIRALASQTEHPYISADKNSLSLGYYSTDMRSTARRHQ